MSASDIHRLETFVVKQFKMASALSVKLDKMIPLNGTCHRQLSFLSSDSKRQFEIVLYLSADGLFLSRELLDTRLDPVMEHRKRIREVAAALLDGAPAEIGDPSAPNILTVFSDFQCPYCAQLAFTLKHEVLPFERGVLKVQFRHFPLQNHQWARQAALGCECARDQEERLFWHFHDFLFENQSTLAAKGLLGSMLAEAERLPHFDTVKFRECLSANFKNRVVDADITVGKKVGILGTPTAFLNGQRVDITGGAVQIRSLLREAAGAEKPPNSIHSAPR